MNGTGILAKLRAKKSSRTILKQMTVWWWCCAMFCLSWPRNCVTIPTLSHLDTLPYSAKSECTEAESSQSKVFEVNMWTSHGKWKWSWRRSKISGKIWEKCKISYLQTQGFYLFLHIYSPSAKVSLIPCVNIRALNEGPHKGSLSRRSPLITNRAFS